MDKPQAPSIAASTENLSRTQVVDKPMVESRGGIVASQSRRAALAGVAVLDAGGDAVDAAVATSFALGVAEPWMSGAGGGGAMVIWRADEQRAYAINFGMHAPAELDPAAYPLAPDAPRSEFFGWPAVLDDRNVRGPKAIAVPGTVAGMGLAHSRYGRLPWRDVLAPAVGMARQGLLVDWYAGLLIASCTRELAMDPHAAGLFLDDGKWPIMGGWTALAERRLDQGKLAQTLAQLADKGAAEFYTGDIAQALARDIQDKGGYLSAQDLGNYLHTQGTRIEDPLTIPYRGARLHAPPGYTAGPSLKVALDDLQAALREPATGGALPGAEAYVAMARALDHAFKQRLTQMGDLDSPTAPACTSHFCVIDRHGNMCAVTQTLLSAFGSKVVSPSTGLLMNNGIMWFDPEPGRPNSLAPGKKCLMNVCPVVGETAAGNRFAVGASGGRKIMGSVMQLSVFLSEYGMTLEDAFRQPRIDMSGSGTVIANSKLPAAVIDALLAAFPTVQTQATLYPYAYAFPSAVMASQGRHFGATEITSPWADAIGQQSGQ
ncbi:MULTISPECIES: gamma-glutamyltransferase [unclassified Achromobacter]|uniref:gamma-glutamyltransferase n=1 Tax=unclassified Achromobacter TaxID=2626865 RepID=UPI000B5173AA|nr:MULTISPECIES: gamma-glutamyltransferase [unclassified Achromobacter]OWT80201.1 gamma-glutamyltransferase [Achromobacter sp. HZ34]OWT82084.1 gamma-glutamyltransferase [Achromobacter sp. HZ28]